MTMLRVGDKVRTPGCYDYASGQGIIKRIEIVNQAADGRRVACIQVELTRYGKTQLKPGQITEWYEAQQLRIVRE